MKRKPRVVRARMVEVCLLFAVVVAVGSVPLLAWRGQMYVSTMVGQGRRLYDITAGPSRGGYASHTWDIGFQKWIYNAKSLVPLGASGTIPQSVDPRPTWAKPSGGSQPAYHLALSVGFPFASARGSYSEGSYYSQLIGRLWVAQAPEELIAWDSGSAYVDVPIVPRWPGLLANTLLFFAIPFAPWTLLRWRRLRRIARLGLCYQCRYEFPREISICPECGTTRPPN